ncbi:hypothetical protein [Halosimplex halophilum]|uniref:hypothetical protein n=1 Tax=Halosimplex halophilum TaxID=2559572 RepID=UPI00107F769F|nr:hypothetical protein [Halosimplex halophilum]
MVSAVDALELVFLVVAHSAVAALMTRFFRVRLSTRWGGFLYAALLVPFALVLSTLFFSGVLPLGPDLGSAGAVVTVIILLPTVAGVTFDYFWMPSPDEVDLPDRWDDRERPSRYENR